MKYFLFVLILAALSFANDDGCTDIGSGTSLNPSGSDDIALVLLNDWVLAEKALGLDIFEGPGAFFVLGVDNNLNYVQAYDAVTGVALGTLPLDPGNGSCFGIAWNDDFTTDTYYTDDWVSSNLFFTDDFGASWSTFANPTGNLGRGMDFDGADYWTTNGDGGGLCRFLPGTGSDFLAAPQLPTQPSGITTFPYGGNIGVAVTTYSTHNIYFYEWDGAALDYIGSAACPAAASSSYGLAYADTNGNIFWSYRDSSSDYHIAEFSFTITSLQRSSWGAIKSSF